MRRRLASAVVMAVALFLAVLTLSAAPAGAQIEPPWCGTPEPDAAEALPSDPPLNFPHIPYYAIECTLERIQAESDPGRMTIDVIGQSATGRDLFLVTINELDSKHQRKAFSNWKRIRRDALTDPAKAQKALARFDGQVKVPIYVQGGIHGNEYQGVDANMRTIETLATTPYGADPVVDEILDNSVVLFNVIQNPDGRVAGMRANGNGFDLNRDFLTQSQPETKASVSVMQEWIPPEMIDLHGYLTPTLIEATTKPHNPSIEYDL
jgi:Zinc carboxypeptidase